MVEICETDSEESKKKKKVDLKASAVTKIGRVSTDSSGVEDMTYKKVHLRKGRGIISFQGSEEVKRPELKWFKHDDNIKRLIEMRCEGKNIVKSKVLELEGASSAVMSLKTASAIDGAVSKLVNAKKVSTMENKAQKEHHSKFVFSIEF